MLHIKRTSNGNNEMNGEKNLERHRDADRKKKVCTSDAEAKNKSFSHSLPHVFIYLLLFLVYGLKLHSH